MSITLTAQHEAKVRQLIESGQYRDETAVVDEALRALEERDNFARLKAAIALGDAQLARGEGIPFTEELLDEIDREVDERIRRGDRPNPDVCP